MRISDWSSDVCSSDLPAPTAGATPAPIASQLVGRLGEIVAEVGREFGGFPLLHAMFGHQLSEKAAVDAPRDIVTRGDRQESARIVVEADAVIETRGLGHLVPKPAHPFGTVVEPPGGAELQRRIMARERREFARIARLVQWDRKSTRLNS